MKRPRRVRRVLKWAGLVVSGLVLALFVLSQFLVVLHVSKNFDGYIMTMVHGELSLRPCSDFDLSPWVSEGWNCARITPDLTFRWPYFQRSDQVTALLPLWLLFLITATATLWLSYIEGRRVPSGLCKKCGYNLTGNVSGVCPECGIKIEPTEANTT